jgi:hypothetical protein
LRIGKFDSEIFDAQLVELPGRDLWWWIGDYQPLLTQIEGFLDKITDAAQG